MMRESGKERGAAGEPVLKWDSKWDMEAARPRGIPRYPTKSRMPPLGESHFRPPWRGAAFGPHRVMAGPRNKSGHGPGMTKGGRV